MSDLAPLSPLSNQRQTWTGTKNNRDALAMPFEDAAEHIIEAAREDGERRDVIVDRLDSWAFGTNNGDNMAMQPVPVPGRESSPHPMRKLAFQQLCGRLSIPADYIETLPKQLQIGCVNWSFKTADESKYKLRLAGEQVRAVLSPKFAAYDDPMLMEIAGEALKAAGVAGDAVVRGFGTGLHTVMRITIPNEAVELRSGDVIEWGLDIGNSEVGLRSVQITPLTYRLICTNGMRSWQSDGAMKLRHVGDEEQLRERVRDAVPVALAEASGHMSLWKKSVDRMIEGVLDHLEGLEGFGLQKGEVHRVGRALANDRGLPEDQAVAALSDHLDKASVYEITNAITSAARERPIDRRLAMEESAHRYLTRYAA